jgi:DNA-binding GntR family transcriptional regulator
VTLAIPRLSDTDLGELAGFVDQMQAAAESGDTYAEATADAAFHGRIVEAAGNATLVRVWRTLEPFSRTYITIVAPSADRRHIADEHVPILEALRLMDLERAAAVLQTHFEDAAAGLASHWAESKAPAPVPEPLDVPPAAAPVTRAQPA